jgi:hypothetical protein
MDLIIKISSLNVVLNCTMGFHPARARPHLFPGASAGQS